MAQGAVATVPSNGTKTLTAEEIHEILECEKIVRFRDAVLSGTHPRIKVPPHLNGKSATRHASTPTSLTPRPNLPSSQVEPKAITPGTYGEDSHNLSNNRPSIMPRLASGRSGGTILTSAKAEINPILLEKSEDLIKAEIQLQRVRLERALREQVEQRRLSIKASAQTSESLPDFDISEVLSKALTIVHPSTAIVAEQPVGDHASASDSFDENTFYSSQHDTPEQSISSQELRERGETSARGIAMTAENSVNSIMSKDHYEPSDEVMMDVQFSQNVRPAAPELVHQSSPMLQQHKLGASYLTNSPGLKMIATDTVPHGQTDGANIADIARVVSGSAHQVQEATVSIHSNMMSERSSKPIHYPTDCVGAQTGASLKRKFAETDSSTSAEILEPAIIRNLEDVPTLAPQPARVSPLATARAPPTIGQSMIAAEATPVQVAALRKPSAASSPESSPKENKASDKKKHKKKKRKSSGKQAGPVDVPDSQYIKLEPRSPSPFAVAPLPRPLQRQRQIVPQGSELNYDEPRYEVTRGEPQEPAVTSRYKEHGPRSVQDRIDDERVYEPRDTELYGHQRMSRDAKPHNRVVSQGFYRAPTSPMMSTGPYTSQEPRTIRAASYAVTDRYGQEAPRYSRDVPPRSAVRLNVDRERSRSPILRDRRSPILMAPPRLPPTRIVFDEYSQQYYAPAPVPVASRRSIATANRHGDDDVIYERTSVRPVTRTVQDVYEQDGVIYRRSSPPPTTSRRVINQVDPDLDYRSYRQREYSSRPVVLAPPPSDEYFRIREPVETRQSEYAIETPVGYSSLGYAPRARSVHPEVVRDEVPRELLARVQSVRPELPPKDYSSSVHQESIRPEGIRRGNVARVQSVRPEATNQDYSPAVMRREPIREGVHREYVEKVQSVRPDKIPQEYAGTARHEHRRENPTQSFRELSVRPGDSEIVRRDYLPVGDGGYAPTTRLVNRRVIDEAEYMERPRDGAHDVYADDGRRDIMY
jgi:hypothetical protein